MGLRINTNVPALNSIRLLAIYQRDQANSLERLATGLRINRAADDPAGLVIASQLKAQIATLNQAVTNTQTAENFLNTADSAAEQISDLLGEIESSVVAVQSGTLTPDQILAEQDSVDQAIAAIDRIAGTTKFGSTTLLNGSLQYQLASNVPGIVSDPFIRQASFATGETVKTLNFTINEKPLRARIQITNAFNGGAPTTIRVTGPAGSADVPIAAAATNEAIASAINSFAGSTGVVASGAAADTAVNLYSTTIGDSASVRLEVLAGTLGDATTTISATNSTDTAYDYTLTDTGITGAGSPGGAGFNAGEVVTASGRDSRVTLNSASYRATGNQFTISTGDVNIAFTLDPDKTAALTAGQNTFTLKVNKGGLSFQLAQTPTGPDKLALGIPGLSSTTLGVEETRDIVTEVGGGVSEPTGGNVLTSGSATAVKQGGFLSSLKTGGTNNLVTGNVDNALTIVQAAQSQVARARGFIGAIVEDTLNPNENVLGVTIDNLSESLSVIQDLDFAEETSNLARIQVLFQSTVTVLAIANLIPQNVFTLLRVPSNSQ